MTVLANFYRLKFIVKMWGAGLSCEVQESSTRCDSDRGFIFYTGISAVNSISHRQFLVFYAAAFLFFEEQVV